MEAALSFYFWAMCSKDTDYKMGDCCPWPLDSFTYNGLCSHSSLKETPKGDLNMTQEQADQVVIAAKRRVALNNAANYKKEREQDLEKYKARKRRYGLTYNRVHPDRRYESGRKYRAKVLAEERLQCTICGTKYSNRNSLDRHMDSKQHKIWAKREAEGKNRFRCKICGTPATHLCHLQRHEQGARHKARAAALAALAATP
ncbi:hypothetical protein LTR84_011238 [Exophiala bonariae]|uniref:C2H2-type domain-containing protein n=1 Tax=Exophiala bonariae TaxID=1690606 RepID=A0AAV9NJ33_9EURO|nr:hypothetical protein LTR84_011238 [Exophiala bonariae]